eukprot:TRINITY_DN45074_c0_g1_i1.p1 TRINITY_DN45074_c0_g1~~TRINITY_DN45074_c0_g1_i1.p1  ORF type:complete len:430 (+),score=80.12 TRINITY_DN45074_c0_g1_i1:72-1361(+)
MGGGYAQCDDMAINNASDLAEVNAGDETTKQTGLESTHAISGLDDDSPEWERVAKSRNPDWMPSSIVCLDLSKCRLIDLPGIGQLQGLRELDLGCNRFKRLPAELADLKQLVSVNASRNFLKPTADSLCLAGLQQLTDLRCLDLRFNEACGKPELLDWFAKELPEVDVRITKWGQIEGIWPAERDATLLRSQLEPWPTPVLRRRLQNEFGVVDGSLDDLERQDVMARLLECYSKEGGQRKVIKMDGEPVSAGIIAQLIPEMRAWTERQKNRARERPSINAQYYMILRSPGEFSQKASKKAKDAAIKLRKNSRLWELAEAAIREVDEDFAAKFTALAVTCGFQGSPHIDKQNCGPFYGLAFGDYPDGQGGLCVECDARCVAEVNTKNRLGKVDGRFPHWVAPYEGERFSLIFYQTEGDLTPPTTAIFPRS